MRAAALPDNENERIKELYRYDVLNTQSEQDFDEIVKLASEICKVPMSLITLIDQDKLWFKAKKGIEGFELNRDTAFCPHAILTEGLMEVPDMLEDERFIDNPLVTSDPKIQFYAGMPLVSENGFKLGTLCVIDTTPRNLTSEQIFSLDVLAKQVIKLFELRLRNREVEAKNAIVESQKLHLAELTSIQNKIISIVAHDVRGPIASLKNIIELRKDEIISTQDVMGFMNTIDKQLDGTLYMLSNLVEWGALLLKGDSLNIGPVNLYDLLNTEFKIFEIPATLKKNQLENNVAENCIVKSDENVLRFMLRNIIANANKFTSEGIITITAVFEKDRYRICITDTGIGMPKEVSDNLFDFSKRKSRKGTNNEDGSGLGLILTGEFAHALGTTLNVISEKDKGTSIHFFIPANT